MGQPFTFYPAIVVKTFLGENKIYLDWASGLLTSVGAILVGFLALRFSRHANRLAENQNEIMKQQLELLEIPLRAVVQFVLDTTNDPEGQPVERLRIFNEGAPITAPFLYKRDFIVVSYETDETGKVNLLIPCYYFSLHTFTANARGLIATLEAYSADAIYLGRQGQYNQTAAMKRLTEEFVAELSGRGVKAPPQVRLRKIVNFGYADQTGKLRNDYFEIREGMRYNHPFPAWRIPEQNVDRLIPEGMLRMSVTMLKAKEILERHEFYERQYIERNIPE